MIQRHSRSIQTARTVESVVCLAGSDWSARHLAPIAAAGGWRLHRTQEIANQQLHRCLVIVAAANDERIAMSHGARGTVLCEHGAGQSYRGNKLAAESVWRGGRGKALGRLLLLAPGPHLARRHRRAHPSIPVEIIGCPALDAWHGRVWRRNAKPVVAVSTHWDCHFLPETRSSWPWVRQMLPALASDPRWTLLGHYHPFEAKTGTLPDRLADYAANSVEVVPRWEDVLQRADLYICDNSSTLFEFAATGRPVVVLQPPWYRRSARHGLRFYDAVPGLLADRLEQLTAQVAEALLDAPERQEQRRRAVQKVFGALDGQATHRAVAAVRKLGFS